MAGLRQVARNVQGDHSRLFCHPLTLSVPRLVKTILVVLFFGPLIAPLFQATQMPLVADSGALARKLLLLWRARRRLRTGRGRQDGQTTR